MTIEYLQKKIEGIFLSLGFTIEFVGTKQLRYLRYQNCHCKISFLEAWGAFVIESADNLEEAEKELLEDGELYYMNIPEDELLHQIEEDVREYYMQQ